MDGPSRGQDQSVNSVTLYHNPRCSESRPALDDESLDRHSLSQAMVEHPILIERPIVVDEANDRAVVGRPPENVLELVGK